MINCKACFHRSQNTTQWMVRSLQERIHDMKGPFVLSWSYQYGKQNWYQHIFWKRGYCVARNLRQIAKVAKTLPSNLWPRLHTIAKTFSRLRVGEQNWKKFFFSFNAVHVQGRRSRRFKYAGYWTRISFESEEKISVLKNTRTRLGPLNTSLRV